MPIESISDSMLTGQFNTNRPYTANGQLIAWKIVAPPSLAPRVLIVFADVSRQVAGSFKSLRPRTNEQVENYIMTHYDKGHYRTGSNSDAYLRWASDYYRNGEVPLPPAKTRRRRVAVA